MARTRGKTAPKPQTAPRTTARTTHKVQVRQRDNLFNLAEKYRTTPTAIAKANPDVKRFLPGQTIRVPRQYARPGSKPPRTSTGMGDLRAFEAQQANAPAPASLLEGMAAAYNATLIPVNPQGPRVVPPTPYTGRPTPTVLPDTYLAQQARTQPASTQPVAKGNTEVAGIRRPRTWRRYGLWVAPQTPVVSPVTTGGGGGDGGGGYTGNRGGGGYSDYIPKPYQGFTGAADRNPFGVRASDERLYGAGIGLINWRI